MANNASAWRRVLCAIRRQHPRRGQRPFSLRPSLEGLELRLTPSANSGNDDPSPVVNLPPGQERHLDALVEKFDQDVTGHNQSVSVNISPGQVSHLIAAFESALLQEIKVDFPALYQEFTQWLAQFSGQSPTQQPPQDNGQGNNYGQGTLGGLGQGILTVVPGTGENNAGSSLPPSLSPSGGETLSGFLFGNGSSGDATHLAQTGTSTASTSGQGATGQGMPGFVGTSAWGAATPLNSNTSTPGEQHTGETTNAPRTDLVWGTMESPAARDPSVRLRSLEDNLEEISGDGFSLLSGPEVAVKDTELPPNQTEVQHTTLPRADFLVLPTVVAGPLQDQTAETGGIQPASNDKPELNKVPVQTEQIPSWQKLSLGLDDTQAAAPPTADATLAGDPLPPNNTTELNDDVFIAGSEVALGLMPALALVWMDGKKEERDRRARFAVG